MPRFPEPSQASAPAPLACTSPERRGASGNFGCKGGEGLPERRGQTLHLRHSPGSKVSERV